MKKTVFTLLSFLAFLLIATPYSAKASHAAAGEIVYEHIADSTYRFYFFLYRDCTGVVEDDTALLCFKNTCNNTGFNVVINKYTGPNGTHLPPSCPKFKNNCDSPASTLPGFRQWLYTGLVTMPAQCSAWKISVYVQSRNLNMNFATSGNFYVETMMNNTGTYQGNSSPYMLTRPVPYLCISQPAIFNNGAIDPNGDSVATEVITPRYLTGNCTTTPVNVTYMNTSPSYQIPFNPIQTNNTFSLNPITGMMSFTPQMQGASSMAVRIKEYRNGVLIGYVEREMQVQVFPCNISAPALVVSTPGVIEACAGQALNFCWYVQSPNPNAKLVVMDNHGFSMPGSSVSYQLQNTDSVEGCFSWTPGLNQGGMHTLTLQVVDSTCDALGLLGYYSYTIQVYVLASDFASEDKGICPGQSAALEAFPSGIYYWSVISGDPLSLSCVTCQYPVATPTVTTKYQLELTSSSGCPHNKDTVTVTLLPVIKPTVGISAAPDTNISLGQNVTFTAAPAGCSNATYQWQKNGLDIPNATASTFSSTTISDMDIITVKMQCTDTCIVDTFSNSLTMHVSTGIKDASAKTIGIYPNPNKGEFTIKAYVQSAHVTIEIVSTTGQVVYKQNNIATINGYIDHQLNTGSIANGTYLLRITAGDQKLTERFSIQR